MLPDKTFDVTNEGQLILCDEYGLRLDIPRNALPDGCAHCNVKIGVSLPGDFQLPEDCVLVSAIYSLTHDMGDTKLRKSATLKMQHCGATEALNGLQILRANDSNKFAVIPGGDFSLHKDCGTIELDHFCFVCIGWFRKFTGSTVSQRYRAKVYYTDFGERSFSSNFYILPHLNSNFTVYERIFALS